MIWCYPSDIRDVEVVSISLFTNKFLMEGENAETRDTLSVLFKQKIPRNAMNYYSKLYTQKHTVQGINHTNLMIESTKVWATLSKEEKAAIKKEYDDFVLSHRKMYAEGLKNIEPYCKKKRAVPASETTSRILSVDDSVNKSDPKQETGELPVVLPPQPPVSHNHLTLECDTGDPHILSESDHSHHIESVPEPAPPKFKTAQELFVMIKDLDDNLSTLSWATMTSTQKRRYQTALTVIKTEYINNYTKYLESLSSFQLYKLVNHMDAI